MWVWILVFPITDAFAGIVMPFERAMGLSLHSVLTIEHALDLLVLSDYDAGWLTPDFDDDA